MGQIRRMSVIQYGIILLALSGLLLLWPGLLSNFFAIAGFEPHGHCYLWEPRLTSLSVIADTLIGISYVVISGILVYFVHRTRRDIPFHWVFLAFGGFIIACGGTHFMDVLLVWVPAYWASGYVRLITAAASVATAMALPLTMPRIFRTIESARLSEERKRQLEATNKALENEIAERKIIQRELLESRNLLEKKTRELEAALVRAESADRAKSALLSTVSHEMRTPLSSIIGFSNLMLNRANLPAEKSREYNTAVNTEARRLAALVDDFLDLQRLESGRQVFHFQAIDLGDLIRDTVSKQHFGDDHRYTFTLKLEPTAQVHADADRIRQVMVNLLSNAVKYDPDGGEIVIHLRQDRQQVIVSVQDHGLGIPREEQDGLFERFYRGSAAEHLRIRGTGLGLALCKEIMQAHKGRVWVESAGANQGSTFSFALNTI